MKVEVKKIDDIKRELNFEVPKERVKEKFDEVYKDLGKVAKIKGFRKGKVPRNVLESQHADVAQEEVIKKIVPEAYQEGIEKEKIHPIDMPDIQDVSLKDGVLTFKASLEIKPDVKIKDYKEIPVKRKDSKVTDEELNKTLEYFKKGQGGDDKDVVIDDAFAHGLGYPNLDEFKKSLSRQLELDKDRQNRMDIENQIVEALLKKSKVTAPSSLVKKQLAHRLEESKKRLQSQGVPEEEVNKKEEDMRKELEPAVKKDIQVFLILDKIAQVENIEIKDGENLPTKVMEFLLKEAKWS